MSRSTFVIHDCHGAQTRDAAYYWWIISPGNLFHFWDSLFQRLRHLSARKVTGAEIEFPDPMTTQGIALYFVVSVPLVLSQDYPRPLGDKGQPDFIQRPTPMEISMSPKLHGACHQAPYDGLAVVEILIQVKDEIVKLQLLGFPSGLPLQSVALRGHIPWLAREPILVH